VKLELEKLIDLQKTDTNLRRLKKIIETANEKRAEIEQEFEQHASSIRDVQIVETFYRLNASSLKSRWQRTRLTLNGQREI
jgi:vacuolar-type H+-ATPase subunit D/Vma8